MQPSQAHCFRLDRATTPIGVALLVTDADGRLCSLDWEEFEPRLGDTLRRLYGLVSLEPGPMPAGTRRALADYFAGAVDALTAIPWRIAGTPFQRAVWRALPDIPAGETESYGALAARLGVPKAVRAVGAANGANPLSLVLPCHRVVGADGSLTGYGGGLERKRWLLAHEQKNKAVSFRLSAVG
jgi:methylated-DNA-[protein]-cysteine S-methyltransferase